MFWAVSSGQEENRMFNRLERREDSAAAHQVAREAAFRAERGAEEELPALVDGATTDERVEEYLDQVCGRLLTLSFAERRQIRDELRSHIEAMADALMELGEARSEAVTQALAKFGKPERVARSFVTAYLSSGSARLASPAASFGKAMRVYGTAALLMIVFVLALTGLATTPHAPGFVKSFAHSGLWTTITMIVPALAGAYMGADLRTQRPGFGSFLGLAAWCGISLPLVVLLFTTNTGPMTLLGVMNYIFFCWIPTATLSATISQWCARRLGRLRHA
jgi:hypothetical protein